MTRISEPFRPDGPADHGDRLAAVWRAAGGAPGRPAPREALTPMRLFPLLPFLAMIDLPAGAPAAVGWVGNGLKERLGGDPAGLAVAASPLAALLPADAEAGLRAGTPWHTAAGIAIREGSAAAAARWLPLADGAGIVTAAVATVSADPAEAG